MRLKELYTYNQTLECYDIEIALERYQDIYNTWDAAPLKRKDIEPDLMDYLEQAGHDIPLKHHVSIVFVLPKQNRDTKKEETTKEAFNMQFKYVISNQNKQLRFNYRRMLTFMLASVIFMSINYLFRDNDVSQMMRILLEGMLVGGWFLMWNVFSIAVLDNYKLRKVKRIFGRYLKSEIVFMDKVK